MDNIVKKAIIPSAGLGTRFLPWTKIVAKEILPLVDKPMVSYAAKEAKDSDIEEIVLILSKEKKSLLDYFKQKLELERVLVERAQNERLEVLQKEQNCFEDVCFNTAWQITPNGDGDAVLKAKKFIGKDSFAVLFPDDIFYSATPALSQLKKVFETSGKPVIGLKKVRQEQLSSYGIVKVEPITSNLFKIIDIVEKPKPDEAPSNFAICGRYVFNNGFLGYLQKSSPNKNGEIILAQGIKDMLEDGQMVYGVEIEGEWLECGKTIDWLKSNLFLALQHKDYGPILKQWLKNNKF